MIMWMAPRGPSVHYESGVHRHHSGNTRAHVRQPPPAAWAGRVIWSWIVLEWNGAVQWASSRDTEQIQHQHNKPSIKARSTRNWTTLYTTHHFATMDQRLRTVVTIWLLMYRALESLVHVGLMTVFPGICCRSILLARAGWQLYFCPPAQWKIGINHH